MTVTPLFESPPMNVGIYCNGIDDISNLLNKIFFCLSTAQFTLARTSKGRSAGYQRAAVTSVNGRLAVTPSAAHILVRAIPSRVGAGTAIPRRNWRPPGGGFRERVWDTPRHLAHWRPKRIDLHGQPRGTQTLAPEYRARQQQR